MKQFCDLLKAHPSIFDVYLAGFHTHIWEVDEIGLPNYCSAECLIEGNCRLLVDNLTASVYIKMIKNTILVFDEKKSSKPKSIINLEGLIVEMG